MAHPSTITFARSSLTPPVTCKWSFPPVAIFRSPLPRRFSKLPLLRTNQFRTTPPEGRNMKQTKRGKIPVFTVADHLKVQMQIEQRAHELWLAGGSRQDTALNNWLKAEREVVEEFIQEVTQLWTVGSTPNARSSKILS